MPKKTVFFSLFFIVTAVLFLFVFLIDSRLASKRELSETAIETQVKKKIPNLDTNSFGYQHELPKDWQTVENGFVVSALNSANNPVSFIEGTVESISDETEPSLSIKNYNGGTGNVRVNWDATFCKYYFAGNIYTVVKKDLNEQEFFNEIKTNNKVFISNPKFYGDSFSTDNICVVPIKGFLVM